MIPGNRSLDRSLMGSSEELEEEYVGIYVRRVAEQIIEFLEGRGRV